jgi:hypothetical protein
MQMLLHMNKFSWLCVGVAVILVMVFTCSSYLSKLVPIPFLQNHFQFQKCSPNSNSPILLNLKTKMHVSYDGGQWFHMAENFLVQHSLLAEQQRQLEGMSIWYNFDKRHFADKLNPFTRFLIFLGTVAPSTNIHSISFLANPDLIPLHTDSIPQSINVGDGILIDRHILEDNAAQTFRLEGGVDPSIRFSQFDRNKRSPERKLLRAVSTSSSSVAPVGFYPYSFELDPEEHHHHHHTSFLPNEVCFKYMGYIGGDRMRRTDWFPNEEDIHSLRATIRLGCPENTDMLNRYRKTKSYKMVFYQRDRTRRFEQLAETLPLVKSVLPSSQWEFHVLYHDNDRSPCELAHFLQDTDVLVTPHGFQATLLLLLPTPALLFEVFPYPYYKPPYKHVAHSMGIVHGQYTSAPTSWLFVMLKQIYSVSVRSCNQYFLCRDLARRQNVILNANGIAQLVATIQQYQPLFADRPDYRNLTTTADQELAYQPEHREFIYST